MSITQYNVIYRRPQHYYSRNEFKTFYIQIFKVCICDDYQKKKNLVIKSLLRTNYIGNTRFIITIIVPNNHIKMLYYDVHF